MYNVDEMISTLKCYTVYETLPCFLFFKLPFCWCLVNSCDLTMLTPVEKEWENPPRTVVAVFCLCPLLTQL